MGAGTACAVGDNTACAGDAGAITGAAEAAMGTKTFAATAAAMVGAATDVIGAARLRAAGTLLPEDEAESEPLLLLEGDEDPLLGARARDAYAGTELPGVSDATTTVGRATTTGEAATARATGVAEPTGTAAILATGTTTGMGTGTGATVFSATAAPPFADGADLRGAVEFELELLPLDDEDEDETELSLELEDDEDELSLLAALLRLAAPPLAMSRGNCFVAITGQPE